METNHQKHTKLKRRENENFAPNEIAILGTNCSIIADFVLKMSKKLQKKAKIGYLDASHSESVSQPDYDTFIFHHSGVLGTTIKTDLNEYNERLRFAQHDLVFINGNHYQGEKQILILDNEKEASLKKRLDQLTRIQFVIKLNDDSKYYDFLIEKFPHIKNIRSYSIDDEDAIVKHINNLIQEKIAPVQGLVLAGGKSTRMGKDKTALDYHGEPQRDFALNLLENNLLKTYVSVAESDEQNNPKIISDKFVDLGAFGAICSAFQHNPNKAWLVLATDLPFVNSDLIQLLLKNRNPKKIATAVKGKSKAFVEPLITIYEPKAYPILLSYLAQGYSCPRKVLINSEVEIVEVDDDLIRNINTPEEYKQAIKEIKNN
ncbi:NTP transferase domain-containing protein [Aureibaculum sp. 2210JD6-5]|uniref:NTP transferase domain-containing protein n=1 Tax=Aureibaculum sp. 2210JD6-5 TaxID=3103957 RepID=UPI002AADE8CB|nr:NTP transferase domain-containing protein [Aureibaculum sp. 2210JD6-5]MDY7396210.1 NTP transferase domain-containing protein [Aureibaculum sp. 2210JD6-5]